MNGKKTRVFSKLDHDLFFLSSSSFFTTQPLKALVVSFSYFICIEVNNVFILVIVGKIKYCMASFEPVVVLYGSSKSISTINFRLPVSFVIATDEAALKGLITIDPQLSDTCLQRYFVVLLESINDAVLEGLQTNHRVQVIYSREPLTYVSNHPKLHRIINKQLQQFTLDLTADIVHFFTVEGEKQAKIERLHLTRIYYRQARLLKEWAMSFVKV
jgi:hypothetical protein